MRLGYVILYVRNVRATVDFYQKAFELKLRFVHESDAYAEMETGQTILAFVNEAMMKASHSFHLNRITKEAAGIQISLVTDYVERQFHHALKNGAISVEPPVKKPWGQMVSCVKDNNGCLIEICSPVEVTNS